MRNSRFLKEDRFNPNNRTRNAALNTPQRSEKMSFLAKEKKKLQKKVCRQKAAIASILQKNAVKLPCDFHKNICKIIQSNSTEVEKTFLAGSFCRLFCEQQKH